MNRAQQAFFQRLHEAKQNDKDRRNRIKVARIAGYANIAGAGVKALSSPTSALISSINDVDWYKYYLKANNLDPSLFTSIPTTQEAGGQFKMFSKYNTGSSKSYKPAGLLVVNIVPSLGGSSFTANDETSEMYKFLHTVYTNLRANNSRVGEYTPSDVGMFLFGNAILVSLWARIRRGLRTTGIADPLNNYVLKYLHNSLYYEQYDYDVEQRAKLIERALQLAADYNQTMFCPSIPLFKRLTLLFDNVFVDSDSSKSQMYAFNTLTKYEYNDVEYRFVATYERSQDTQDLTKLLDQFENIMGALKNSSVFSTLIAELKASFMSGAKGEVWRLDTSNLSLDPLADAISFNINMDILSQIKNSVSLPVTSNGKGTHFPDIHISRDISGLDVFVTQEGFITQGTYSILSPVVGISINEQHFKTTAGNDELKAHLQTNGQNLMIDYINGQGSDEIIEATRLRPTTNVYISGTNQTWNGLVIASGSEVVVDYSLYLFDQQMANDAGVLTYHRHDFTTVSMLDSGSSASEVTDEWLLDKALTAFANAPMRYGYTCSYQDDYGVSIVLTDMISGGFEDYSLMPQDNVNPIHKIALKSEYYIAPGEFSFTK